jgi:outer membrane protein OmpA-like peptidoglycan-associated protein
MAANLLLDQVSSEFGGDALNRIASTIGESPGKIKTALSDILPALLGGLAGKAQTKEGAHELLDVIHRDHLDTEKYEHVADAIKEPNALGNLMNAGGPLLDTVLPGKSGAVSDWVASHSGINPASSKSLMSMVLPLVLGWVGRRVGGGGESGLTNMLGKPQNFLEDAPGALAGMLGMGGAAAGAGAARATVSEFEQRGQQYAAAAPTRSRKWLVPLLVVLGLIALLGYFMSRRTPVQPTAPLATETAPATPTAPAVTAGPGLGAFIDKKLPNGTTLHIPANGVENKLIAFIEDGSQQVNPATWFRFDRLEFDTNASTLKASSQEQLRNIAEIMKAYPQVKMKFGGYTDNTGNPQQNVQLSGARATSAMNQVVAQGVDASRMTAEGYGEQNPIADNATDEGRQRNRRVAISVTAK